jgi:hypothetical protein
VCPQLFRAIEVGSFLSLEEFELEFALETADGRWFYEDDEEAEERSRANPEYAEYWEEMEQDSESGRSIHSWSGFQVFEDGPLTTKVVDDHIFRSKPDQTTLMPFLMESVIAVQRLPRLKKLILALNDRDFRGCTVGYPGENRAFQLWYIKAGSPRSPDGNFPKVQSDTKYINQNRLYWNVGKWTPWEEVQAAWDDIVGPGAKIVWLDMDKWKSLNYKEYYFYDEEF